MLLLRVPDPAAPPPLDGNSLLDALGRRRDPLRLARPSTASATTLFRELAVELRARRPAPLRDPRGRVERARRLGLRPACRRAARRELAATGPVDASSTPPARAGPARASSSGCAGLAGRAARAVGFAVCDDRAYFQSQIADIVAQRQPPLGSGGIELAPEQIAIIDSYIGPGYGQTTPEMLAAIRDVARADGIVLDPVYTGKAFFGLTRELAARPEAFGAGDVVFLHTGGIFGLFPFADGLRRLV